MWLITFLFALSLRVASPLRCDVLSPAMFREHLSTGINSLPSTDRSERPEQGHSVRESTNVDNQEESISYSSTRVSGSETLSNLSVFNS